MNANPARSDRLAVTYRLTCAAGETAQAKARDIALEQTVELPEGCFPDAVGRVAVGRVESVAERSRTVHEAVVTYDIALVGRELPQLTNLLFGNISLKRGILVTAVDWPPSLLERFAGPRFGIDGLRRLCRVTHRRPLVCTALKPLGLSAVELARRCADFARGGIDLIKDDHGLTDQSWAPFEERVQRCAQAVARANAITGGNSLYVPHVSGPADEIQRRVETAKAAGCRCVLVCPLVTGIDWVRAIAARYAVAVLAHPALAGSYFARDHGLTPAVLLGQLFRIAGSDGVVYPNVGGRFPLDGPTCEGLNEALRGPLGRLRPAFPVPAGGIDAARVPEWIERYGADTIFLVGGSLYREAELERAARRLVQAVHETETQGSDGARGA